MSEQDALATLHAAVDAGVNFFDTADVYGDGRSEPLVGRLLRERGDAGLTVAAKMGRRADPPGELVDGGGGVRRLAGQLVDACRAEFCDLFVGAAVES